MPRTISLHTANDTFQQLEVLQRNRNKRHRARAFVVEGVRNIHQALAADWPIQAFLYEERRPLSRWATNILQHSAAPVHYELTSALMAQLSDKEETSELLCVCAMPDDDPDRLSFRDPPLIVLFDRPASRGNLGTLIRSCDALGAGGLIVTGHGVDPYDPETIRASTGSFFALPVVTIAAGEEMDTWIASARTRYPDLQIVGTSEQGSVDIADCGFLRPTLLFVGNETDGLSHRLCERCDVLARIPMGGTASSLNVACAASIALYEIDRQRRAAGL